MYKIIFLFLGFSLLVSCGNHEKISENIHQNNQKNSITIELTPVAEIEVENEDEITGIQFNIENTIGNKTLMDSTFETLPEVEEANQKNTFFLRSHKEKILANFPKFKNNPTTEMNEKNISVTTSVDYNLLNDIYTLHSE